MKFGAVENPAGVHFTLPVDHPATAKILAKRKYIKPAGLYVGCAKWSRTELTNFYPRGTTDELLYYATQFNSIEMNVTFRQHFLPEQFLEWRDKTPADFRFFPKVHGYISHSKWLNDIEKSTEKFTNSVVYLQEKLGTIFLQLRPQFAPKFMDRLIRFIDHWPAELPLAVELRHTDWFNDPDVATELYQLFEEHNIANILVDTAGRRDLLHMRLTSSEAFIRFVGANHPSDYTRLEEWVARLKSWWDQGLRQIRFFIHQNAEVDSPKLAAYFIEHLNNELGCTLHVPHYLENGQA